MVYSKNFLDIDMWVIWVLHFWGDFGCSIIHGIFKKFFGVGYLSDMHEEKLGSCELHTRHVPTWYMQTSNRIFLVGYLGITVRVHLFPIMTEPPVEITSSEVKIYPLTNSCRDISLPELMQTDRVDWSICRKFDPIRIDVHTVKTIQPGIIRK